LREVPGFYRDLLAMPGTPSPGATRTRWLNREFGEWRINLPFHSSKAGLLVPYDSPNCPGQIVGIRIFRNVRDQQPTLLTSRGLPEGAKAIPFREAVAA
jgi:hypothetical protein